jgi:hypothetical protein
VFSCNLAMPIACAPDQIRALKVCLPSHFRKLHQCRNSERVDPTDLVTNHHFAWSSDVRSDQVAGDGESESRVHLGLASHACRRL